MKITKIPKKPLNFSLLPGHIGFFGSEWNSILSSLITIPTASWSETFDLFNSWISGKFLNQSSLDITWSRFIYYLYKGCEIF